MINLFDIITIELRQIILPIIYIALGTLSYAILKKIIKNIINRKNVKLNNQQLQRIQTVKMLILNIIKYVVVILVILAILSVYGVNVSSLVAGLGITTAIIGLALQDLAKDFIAGISIITEGQYEVGDTIEVDGFMGEVIFVGLKTTRIRNYKGATKIIANHNMDKIINYSLHNSLAEVDVITGYDCSPTEVEKVLQSVATKIKKTIPEAKGELQILGITEFDDSKIVYRVALEVESMQHFAIERYLRKEIKEAFDKNQIKLPFLKIEVHNGK